jgi:hypothetical protein
MRVFNDFSCDRCGVLYVDRYEDNTTTSIKCKSCDGMASKVRAVPRFVLPGNDKAGFPTAHAKWERNREQKIAQEMKQEQ